MSRSKWTAAFLGFVALSALSPSANCQTAIKKTTAGSAVRKSVAVTPAKAGGTTSFEGKVLSIERKWFPDVDLLLELSKIGDPAALRDKGARDHLKVVVRTKRIPNQPFASNLKNVNLAGAYYLLAGDSIRGILRYDGGAWSLDSMMRLPSVAAPKIASLQVELSADRDSYLLGEDARLTLTVSNRGMAPAVFNFPNAQKFDFSVRQNGREVWRWSRGKTFETQPSSVSVNPGDALSFHGIWPGIDNQSQPVDPGSYTVVGWLTASGKDLITESSAEIEVKDNEDGPSVSDLIATPKSYVNKEIELEGFYRAHLAERDEPLTQSGPPVSRVDWILQDTSGSIYVHCAGKVPFADADINKRVKVKGLLRMNPEGVLYLWAWDATIVPDRGH